ncbi:hypothetical protein BH11BAC2_BH11BAC2_09210 [soil metagenome]
MKVKLLLFLLLINALPLFSEIPYFRSLVIDKENSSLRNNVLFQDQKGFVWVGTDHGLYRYDGFLFEKIYVDSINREVNVTSITENKQHQIIAGLNDGKLLTFYGDSIRMSVTPAHSPIRSIVDDGNGTLWVATYGEGIFYRRTDGWHRVAGMPDPFVYSLALYSSGVILAGTDLGLMVIETQNQQMHFKVYDAKKGLPDNMVRKITIDALGEIWLGLQEKGICRFDINSGTFDIPVNIQNWSYGPVNSMTLLQNEFWIATESNGIVDFEFRGDKRTRVFNKNAGFNYGKIIDLLRDREGNVWVATENRILMSQGEKVEINTGEGEIKFDSIKAITCDRNGDIWFSNHNGLFRYNYKKTGNESLEKFLEKPEFRMLHIVSLFEDEEGFIWIGTFDNGLFRLNPLNGSVIRFNEKDGLDNANVISINGRGNTLWLATLGGVVRCDVSLNPGKNDDFSYSFHTFPKQEGPGNIFVYCVFIDSKNRVWFGTDGGGLSLYENGKFTTIKSSEPEKSKVVYSITEDLYGNIWFNTLNHGVYRYNGSGFRNFGLQQGLRELNISGLTTDIEGNIVVVHQRGIDLINSTTFEVDYIGRESGIELLDAELNAVAKDRKGSIWIGSEKGLIRFFHYNRNLIHKSETIIRKIYTFMKPGSNVKDSVFDYNQNQISIEFIGLWYSNPDEVSYRYRLLGLSTEWINTKDRIVTFPNLPPGNYTFEVLSSKNGQFHHAKLASFPFVIHKPFWKETWVLTGTLILFIVLLVFFLRDREIRFRRMEGLKKEKIVYQYETLKSQVNPHFLFNSFNTLISIIEDDQEKAVLYVEKLSDYFRNMVQFRDQDTISLEQELEMVSTYSYLQQKRFGANLVVDIQIPENWKRRYQVPPLSLQLLIENAVKHNSVSHETPLIIVLEATDHLSLIVRNNLNPKATAEPSTGIGIENIVNRFRILNNTDVIIKRTSKEFIVEVPLIA